MGLCDWNCDWFFDYKKEGNYCLYLVGYLDNVKVVYYVYKDNMYFYLRLICKLQIMLEVYDIWMLVQNIG